jgi:hypothetical protein
VPPTISAQPASQTVLAGQTATFSVTAAGSPSLSYEWQKNGTSIMGANSASYTTPATTTADSGALFTAVVSSAGTTLTSQAAVLTVNAATDVLTYHNDNQRSGQNLTETSLTTSNVNSTSFGKLGFFQMDGMVEAQPLYVSNVVVPGNGTHNLLIAASENGSVYAFDADSGATIWQVSTLKPGELPAYDPACSCDSIGVSATPAIDRSGGPNGVIYLVGASRDVANSNYQRLHALDLALGTEMFNGPVEIQATYPGTGDNSDGTNVIFDPMQYRERAALLLLNGVVYTTWASYIDNRPYTGWIIAYDASTLSQSAVLNVTPNGNEGAIWMSGAGPAADSSGNIYFLDANGVFDSTLNSSGFPSEGDYGNAFIKLSTTGNQLAVADYFETYDGLVQSSHDSDFGSGGAMVLPDVKDGTGNTLHLAVGAGKDGNLYVVNRDSMGKYDPDHDNDNAYQVLLGALPGGVFATPAYFNNTVYYGPEGNAMRAFSITNAKLSSSPSAQTANVFIFPGTTPSISANGTKNGIVWAFDPGGSTTYGVLRAFDASTLNELYDSNQAGTRDQVGSYNRFVTPTIANGKVFVDTSTGVFSFGLLPN